MDFAIPPPHAGKFTGAIVHPDLFLWDSWSFQQNDETHLYCLAVSRADISGRLFDAALRNERPFHVRHFLSLDEGLSWSDEGCFQQPRLGSSYFDAKTIWSGSVSLLPDGRKLVAYTGINIADPDLPFQQSIALAVSNDGHTIDELPDEPLSCPIRDWDAITSCGYYLDDIDKLGHKDGEAGGPILAWRDPFVLAEDGAIHLFWAAKVGSHQPAMAHATVEETASGFVLTHLHGPITVPDDEEFTQLELPKILHDEQNERYYLLISTCNRRYEGQSDAEVDKRIRLYSSDSMSGPWQPACEGGSTIFQDEDCLFGMTVLSADFEGGKLHCVSPYTDASPCESSLSISKAFTISLET